MQTKPISQLDRVSDISSDDLFLISRKVDNVYGISYNVSYSSVSSNILGNFQEGTNLSLEYLAEYAEGLSNVLSDTILSVLDNRLCIEYNNSLVSSLSRGVNDISSHYMVKRQKDLSCGSITKPVFVSSDGFVYEISSYEGNANTATKATKDSNGNIITDTYFNKVTGGTISGDLKLLVDDEEKSLSTLLKEAGSVKTVNSCSSDTNGNVEVYASDIKLSSTTTQTVYSKLTDIYNRLDSEVNRLNDIV